MSDLKYSQTRLDLEIKVKQAEADLKASELNLLKFDFDNLVSANTIMEDTEIKEVNPFIDLPKKEIMQEPVMTMQSFNEEIETLDNMLSASVDNQSIVEEMQESVDAGKTQEINIDFTKLPAKEPGQITIDMESVKKFIENRK